MPKLILGRDQLKQILRPERRTNPLIWGAAIICTIIAIAVIITGIVLLIGYMIIRPRVPFISVTFAHLDKISYDQTGLLNTQITLIVKAENDNAKAHASFSDINFLLHFNGLQIAQLRAGSFDVPKNNSVDLKYVVPSFSIPLEPDAMEDINTSLKRDKISFNLKGNVRTRWRVGVLGPVKFWSSLSCQLQFFPSNGSSTNSHCSSKSK